MHGPVEFVFNIFKTFQSDFIELNINKKKTLKNTFSSSFLDMPRIAQNLRERAIGMFNAGMTMNAVVVDIGRSTRAIRHLGQRFQATGHTEDRPRSRRPRVTTHGQDRYIRNTHQTSTATAANTHGSQNKRISAQTVRNRLRGGELSARCPHVGCVLPRRHRSHRVKWACRHKRLLRQQWNSCLFSDESRFTIHRGDGRVRVYLRRKVYC